ncbi:hypothetical protein NQ317_017405 [Molorchus minor]|uniref:Sodium channel protein Nach n=1 Tax=Molorchus minor TaxID=1323400 RepID=A0ABQ9JJ93_9CUCU|nr:hypothetical protein NQ317_017405 [Molorchus minor]
MPMLWDFVKFVLRNSSIHGLPHTIERRSHPIERTLWCGIVSLAVYGTIVLSTMTLTRYRDNPTVISMERDRFSWNTSFPAATICPSQKVDVDALDVFLSESTTINNKSLFRDFILTLGEATYSNFDKVVPYEEVTSDDYISLLRKFMFKFRPSVSNSGISGERLTLHETVTEMGICYSFNSHLAVYNSFDYWSRTEWKLLPENESLSVNPLDGEVFANVVNMSSGFQVYVHGPYEVIDIRSKHISSQKGYFLQLYLMGLTLFSSESIKSLRVNQRKCRFYYESNLRHFPVYSYVLCRMECRATLANRLCECIPHFYRKIGRGLLHFSNGERVCNVSGLHCLSKYKERLTLLKGECSCLPNCDEVNYVIDDIDTREWFLGSNLQWGLKDYPKMRLRRDIIFGFSDLLVYIGGMAGLFLGCSVLSFIEIFYYFTLRLYWFLRRHGRESNIVF